jgi:hypothetical protein
MFYKQKLTTVAATLILFAAMPVFAVPPAPQQSSDAAEAKEITPTFYNLVFRVIDRDGKRIVSSRSYKTSIAVGKDMTRAASIESTDSVPFKGAAEPNVISADNLHSVGFTLHGYNSKLVGDKLSLYMEGNITSLPQEEEIGAAASRSAILRKNNWQAWVVVSMSVPTIVYSSDDPTSTHVFEVELTATPMGAGK